MSEEVLAVPLETELDALFGQYVAADQAPGLVYGLSGPDGLLHARGFGRRDDAGQELDLDTIFPIASMSKSFSACAALIARDRGLLSLEDPITKYVPEFRLSDGGVTPDGMPTIGMLFSMCGGLTEDNSWVDPFIDLPTEQLLAIVEAGVRLSRPPGAAFEYSNLGFALACLAVSRAVGQPLTAFLREEILDPLGLSSTYADSEVPDGVPRATGYSLDTEGRWVGYPPQRSDAFTGAGGLVSTVRNLTRWITWLGEAFRPDSDHSDPVLGRMSRRELQRVHVPVQPALFLGAAGGLNVSTASGYALGLIVQDDLHRGTIVCHSGGLPGFSLHMRWHPQSGNGVVVLTNSHRGNPVALATEALGRRLAREGAAAETVRLWPETVALCAKTDALIRDWDDALAAEIFADNVDFDRPLSERRKEIESLVREVGPLLAPRPEPELVSAVTPADVTWSIPGENGELICMIHLTPVEPAQIQEIAVRACGRSRPRAARPIDISPRRKEWGEAFITPVTNVEVRM
ncbi:MAG TPA: serine hydrolase domain-containing protein [Solirubrobacteraceae bacterium]|nr:serine hydrolase domain-containing protein [Solirubrobacteraceae bacterium]